MKKTDTTYRNRQAGVVSIIVATLLIVIVSLLVLAFSQLSRREQRESLDNQLSAQAFYAAETGVNDVKAAIPAVIAVKGAIIAKTTCGNDDNYTLDSSLSDPDRVSYTCVLVDPTPPYLKTSVGTTPKVLQLQSAAGAFGKLTFTWSSSSTQSLSDCPATASFPKVSNYNCPLGGIRMDLVKSSGVLTRDGLIDSDMVAFLMPAATGAGSTTYNSTPNSSQNIPASCSTAAGATTCSVTVNGVGAGTYFVRLSAVYKDSTVTITSAGHKFANGQVLIDSTGKAQDVLRRIVVSAPLTAGSNAPAAAIASGDSVCKRFNIDSVTHAVSIPASIDGGESNPLCNN